MGPRLWRGAVCLLLAGGAVGLVVDSIAPGTETDSAETERAEVEAGRDQSEVQLKKFVFASPAANSYTVDTDIAHISKFSVNDELEFCTCVPHILPSPGKVFYFVRGFVLPKTSLFITYFFVKKTLER